MVVGGVALGVGIIGVSIWRTVAPVNIGEALNFFHLVGRVKYFQM